jgi:two-component system, cell cycle sensor histidine kinase and response regulator CckA
MLNATATVVNDIQPTLPLATRDDPSPTRHTILVVEDEAFVREATCDILEGEGYRVLRAHDAAEARAAFHHQQGNVQLLLSDVVLPGQNGLALARDLTAARPALRVMFISGYAPDAVNRFGLILGSVGYLPKPFSAAALLVKVREVLLSEEPVAP